MPWIFIAESIEKGVNSEWGNKKKNKRSNYQVLIVGELNSVSEKRSYRDSDGEPESYSLRQSLS